MESGETWGCYYSLMKASSLVLVMEMKEEFLNKKDLEKLRNEVEEMTMICEMKISQKEKNSLDVLFLTGSSKIGVLGNKNQGLNKIFTFTELKNKLIKSIACEDHYSLAVIKTCNCIQNSFEFNNCLVFILTKEIEF